MKGTSPTKQHKCRICKSLYQKRSMTHIACSSECAMESAKRKREKLQKRDLKLAKERLKPRSRWLTEAQTAFNTWVRARDQHLSCISCGTTNQIKYNAGHYLSVGAHPELRFNELNVHKQCEKCNSYLSGNIVAYRPKLIEKIGLPGVEYLEGKHEPKKYTIGELKEIKAFYKEKLKLINN